MEKRVFGESFVDGGKNITVHSPLLGEYELRQSDPVERGVADALMTDVGRRASGVSLLSTTHEFEIHPNASKLDRMGHVADVAWAVISVARRLGLSPADAHHLVREIAHGDLYHGPFSHLSDRVVEGVGGREDYHDRRVVNLEIVSGLNDIDWRTRDEVGQPSSHKVPSWADNDDHLLTVDKLVYGGSEMLTKYQDIQTPESQEVVARLATLLDPERLFSVTGNQHERGPLRIIDGNFVFTDLSDALFYGKNYLLLSEHWNSVVKRLSDKLLTNAIKATIIGRHLPDMDSIDGGISHYPLDYLLCTDYQVVEALNAPNAPNYLHMLNMYLMRLSTDGLRAFNESAADYMRFLLYEKESAYPNLGEHFAYDNFTLISTDADPCAGRLYEVTDGDHMPGDLTPLKPPKHRFIDPLVETSGGIQRLTEVSDEYREILRQHGRAYRKGWMARLSVDQAWQDAFCHVSTIMGGEFDRYKKAGPALPQITPVYARGVAARRAELNNYWEAIGQRPTLSPEAVQRMIHQAGEFATRQALQSGKLRVSGSNIVADFRVPQQ